MFSLSLFAAHAASGAVAITSPASGAKLSSSSILKGSCSGTTRVSLSGPGIPADKTVACRSAGNWEYPLVNAFEKMANGTVTLKAVQGSSSNTRSFVKGATSTSPTPAPTPTPSSGSTGGSSSAAPGTNFDLSLWKLTLPLDSSGGKSGTAAEVKPLTKTYQKAPYFYTGSDGAMVFSAPTDGATTSGSKYPRSELRELTSSGGNAAWTVAQGGTLSATLAVNEMPKATTGTSRIVIGQIHGPDDELCRLYYDNGVLYFVDDKAGSSHAETKFTLKSSSGATTKIPLNSKFSYTIKATSKTMQVTAEHNGVSYSASEPISSFWPGKALYFKAGVYLQVSRPGSGAGSTGTGNGKASFYKLSKPSHP